MKRCLGIFILIIYWGSACALGIRTFVAVPVAQGDWIFRFLDLHNLDTHRNEFVGEVVHSFTDKQTVFLALPTRLHPTGRNRTGDVNILYRYTVLQKDELEKTLRGGLLIGGHIPTNNDSNGGVDFGGVVTYFKDKNQVDADVIWKQGIRKTRNFLRYDLSWQHRIYPATFGDQLTASINTVMEYNGRYVQHNNLIHQITAGLQIVSSQVVIDGGIVKDINRPHDIGVIASVRIHV